MRRGHPGVGGWRNENHRHFRPRAGGALRFRPPRAYSLLEIPRFPPPGPRLPRGPHTYNAHLNEHGISDNHDRQNYRPPSHHNNPRLQDRHQQRPRNVYSYTNVNYKKGDTIQNHSYKHSSNFYKEAQGELLHVNSHGDVDHRQLSTTTHNQDSFNPPMLNPWIDPPPNQRHFYEDRNQPYRPHDTERHHAEGNKIPSFDYTGHRPPSSDYYGSTSSTTINNNDTSFSRSVNDTVDIVRKRLMNRSDPQPTMQDASNIQNNSEQEQGRNTDQHTLQDPPTKKRTPRQRQNVKSNCDKMKSNIVNELFKMDKDKMHKLMDDPGSSSKFEYAISSLITESQNSLNRHLRSVAEKSLVSTCSDDFIHNDNNTIYEDTFMKQMQCLLDPQDTILLEDIKPLVMAELSKVLQLDDFEPYTRYDADDQRSHAIGEVPQNYPNYENFNYDEFPQEVNYDIDLRDSSNYGDVTQAEVCDENGSNFKYENQTNEDDYHNSKPIFERRTSRHNDPNHENRRLSVESHRQRKSIDNAIDETFSPEEPVPPLFNSNTEVFSEEEDTFAELDRQYHVAVDPNFLEDVSARTTPNYMLQVEVNPASVKKEVNNQLQSSKSLLESVGNNVKNNREINVLNIKEEPLQSPDFPKENSTPINSDSISCRIDHVNMKQVHAARCNDTSRESEKSKSSSISKTSASNSRKRSIDQRPSHRKEKRKKSESSFSDRHDNSNSKDRHSKCTATYNDLPKSSYYSIFRSKDDYSKQCSKDNKRNNNSQKGYSEKYVKRKQSQKSKNREPRKNRTSSSSSQTILSPKDCNNTSITPAKSVSKTKLKPIDMFVEQTKKVSLHHAHRNTATTPATPTTPVVVSAPITPAVEDKAKQVIPSPQKIVQTKHVSTQVFKRVITKATQTVDTNSLHSQHCQTENPEVLSVGIQTTRVFTTKAETETKDAFERMKQIDLEIQELLREKFQLYSNLESNNMGPHEEQSYLSVTVLNVAAMDHQEQHIELKDHIDTSPVDKTNSELKVKTDIKMENESSVESTMTADAIVDDFTNIPVEELEQIALETVTEDINFDDAKVEKRNARHKALLEERMTSESPKSTSSRRSSKKAKTPNISLLEQIITDDRPLEDIISLDDLEEPRQTRKKALKSKPKKTTTKKSKSKKQIDNSPYVLKECSVILIQTDISKYLNETSTMAQDEELPVVIDNIVTSESSEESLLFNKEPPETQKSSVPREIIEETVVNDLQFDMLDVSEDIVIGESCEIKDKDSIEPTVAISEDLILDNSQSSADDALVGDSCQAENECKTYDYSTDEELRRDSLTVTGNVDAVLAIECIESDFIAACLDGNVYHFSGDGLLLNTMRGSNLAVTCLTIVKEKYGTTVYTGSLDSRIRYYDLNTGLEKGPECNVLSPIQTMDRAWDTVFVGTRTGFVLQFECKNNMLIPVSTVKFSEQAILALRAMKEGPRKVLLVASRSENVTIKDAQTGLLLRTLAGPKMTVYTLLFEDGKVYCGTSSHQIHVFDYSSGTHTGCHEGGKGAVCLRATGGLLFAGCYDGCVYVYREGETRPLAQLRGPSLMLLSLAVVGSKIIAGYKDRSLYIWKIPLSILQEMIL
ncbi:unnamed protein product [Arctia plantaginis]|uniref:Zinc finger protein 106 n=1 Tax=Arctia plantaginis TaxID=874455 RepID=A0A8S1ALC6_ARCPL|nr:unnamed protein product [Arctia plantaginis]